ncbi:hypothetical protein Bca52824_064656 [Brassica carinata]|uniref:DUF4283 domain-containing protein n=1 Tax=Brassica carinata TaxID=52824 RepID=A0A8X7QGT0_BRACI|nr:hypothetical protein Bca52824_064656 [Brassica carinata]
MSPDEEEPLDLGSDPSYRVLDENETSLMGRLLNPECQSMARMIDYMPTAWRVTGRVWGIALSRDRFQFIFQREEDLQTVLKDRPWSYNHWAMVLERWTANPPEDFLQSMMVWIRIRNIPANFFTTKTMYKLASEIGMVEEIAYDPKVSHTKDYIRALVSFRTENPLKASRNLTIPDKVITIEYEYEKIHKRCFHCLRMTHEKIRCPLLRRGNSRDNARGSSQLGEAHTKDPAQLSETYVNHQVAVQPNVREALLDGPPGFPLMFLELSRQDRKMAMMYISHSNETKRLPIIERVKQGIAETQEEAATRLPKITRDLDKGKGHVFDFFEPSGKRLQISSCDHVSSVHNNDRRDSDTESASSSLPGPTFSAPALVSTGFRLGPSSEGRVTGNQSMVKSQRRRPNSWKRKALTKPGNVMLGVFKAPKTNDVV